MNKRVMFNALTSSAEDVEAEVLSEFFLCNKEYYVLVCPDGSNCPFVAKKSRCRPVPEPPRWVDVTDQCEVQRTRDSSGGHMGSSLYHQSDLGFRHNVSVSSLYHFVKDTHGSFRVERKEGA